MAEEATRPAPQRPLVQTAPQFTADEAEWVAHTAYGLQGRATPLPSERDQNFLIETPEGKRAVLKFANEQERQAVLDLENQVVAHLAAAQQQVAVPAVLAERDGRVIGTAYSSAGGQSFVRMVTFVPGRRLAAARPHSAELLRSLGRAVAFLDAALKGFSHAEMRREFHWDLQRTAAARKYLPELEDAALRALVEGVLERFEARVAPALAQLPAQLIHNDANDSNVLVTSPPDAPGQWRVTGIVDFGDVVHAPRVCDLAVACAYALLGKRDWLAAAADVVAGYHAVAPLEERELDLLFDLIRARLCLSLCLSAHQARHAPANEYLLVSRCGAGAALAALAQVAPEWPLARFRAACGMEACPNAARVRQWLDQHRADFAPVVSPDPQTACVRVFDLSAASLELDSRVDPAAEPAFSAFISGAMKADGADMGVGRYNEARLCYRAGQFAREGNDGPEWRTIHIGMDLFQPAGAPVFAPLEGTVHSFADNALPLDYGPTIILRHDAGGAPFFTLYGHLSRESLAGLTPGMAVTSGQKIAELGAPAVNGGWPPHLHFQIVCDLLGKQGDFPGVATPAEREVWLSLCPDPNLILRVPPERFPAPPRTREAVLESRRARVGPSLSVSYRKPLHIVRGYLQQLWDADGRIYLDAINNVPHVGHCHPRVVQAVARQAALLATNTRYLYSVMADYAERLTALLPEPLRVCYLVNSGSEANELALRLARAATGRRGVVAVAGAYHGNTTTLIEVSEYKFAGPGGAGRAAHVQVAPMPDPYRACGRCGSSDPTDTEAGRKYAQHVGEAFQRAQADGVPAGAFIFESLPGTGGMIVPAAGYLGEAYRLARAAGAVCIADEVQVGFGRVGTHVWGFEAVGGPGVLPDIVTMGKPIGNGFPLGAVVTTREIADAFANGMEYFNTFGGNPVACAAGLAVLDVMREEGLMENALPVGEQLLAGLRDLQTKFPLIGDVRGMGLFIGAELVRDRQTLKPATAEAAYIAERMKDRGILISTDGPRHHVLKIRPPMCFTAEDAQRLLATLAIPLAELTP
jgi:4-aminobutyrate aminotransferase-like enzyme/Ser/Thr protein kinase RdoA (MazF antagonist)